MEGAGGLPGILAILDETYQASSEAYREWLTDYMSPAECPACHGKRLRPASLSVRVKNFAISEFTGLPIARALMTVRNWELTDREKQIAGRVVDEIRRRLEFLSAVGLDYLSLDRSSATLSGGEAQRIRLATQIGSKLRGVLYVLDEPSIGLHPRDNNRLLETLTHLRDMGNTVLVVEHDAETIERADYVIDLGPGAGRLGGELVASGTPRRNRAQPGIAHRPVSLRRAEHSRPRDAPQGQRQETGHPRRARAQSERRGCRNPARPAHRGHRRFGQRKIHADQRDSLPRAGQGGLRLARRARRARFHRGHRPSGQGDPHRPGRHRPYAALQSRHLYRPLHAHPRSLRHAARIARARLQAGTLQLQREGRPLRGLPGRRTQAHRDELPAGRLRHLRSCAAGAATIARPCR